MPRFKEVARGGENPKMVQLTEQEEASFDTREAEWRTDHPEFFETSAARTWKINRMKAKIKRKYEKYVDNYYAKLHREKSEGGSYTVPQKIKDFVSSLQTTMASIKSDVNLITDDKAVRRYKPENWPPKPPII